MHTSLSQLKTTGHALGLLLALMVLTLGAACSEDAAGGSAQPCPGGICPECTSDEDCPEGESCRVGFCAEDQVEEDAGPPDVDMEDEPDPQPEPQPDVIEDVEDEPEEDVEGDVTEDVDDVEDEPEEDAAFDVEDVEDEPNDPVCEDDEEEENDRPAQAPVLLVGQTHEFVTCPDDEDWYIVRTERREDLEITIGTQGTLSLDVIDFIDGRTVLASAQPIPDGYLLRFSPEEPGNFLVRVTSETEEAFDYTLRYLGLRLQCEDDDREDDDFLNDANDLVPEDTPLSGFLCENDEDWFAVEIEDFFQIDVSIEYDDEEVGGLLRVGLYDADEELIAQTNNANRDFAFVIDTGDGGTYFLKVDGQDAEGAYTINVGLSLDLCDPDGAEPNDLPEEATELEDEVPVEGLVLCENDVDWFSFEAEPNQTIRAEAILGDEASAISVDIIAPDAQSIISNLTEVGTSRLAEAITRESGTHFVRVFSEAGDRDDFSITLNVDPCIVDEFEPNNTPDRAATPTLGLGHNDLRVCDQDRDWFLFEDVPEAHVVTVETGLGFGQGDLVARWFAAGDLENPIQEDPIDQPNATLTLITDAAGDLFLEISGDTDERGYTFRATIEDTAECAQDGFEPNDFLNEALQAPVEPGFFEDLSICSGDFDLFCTTVPPGQTITATATFTHNLGDLELQLLDDRGLPLASSGTDQDLEQVSFLHTGDLDLVACAQVSAQFFDPNVENDYDLVIEVTGIQIECEDDNFEDNDDALSASLLVDRRSAPQQPIPPGRIFSNPEDRNAINPLRGLAMCEGDEDLYAFQGRTDDELQIDLLFAHQTGDLTLDVLREGEEVPLATSDSGDDNESLTLTLPANDTYLIRVTGDDTFRQVYGMDVALRGACVEDEGEPNEEIEGATLIEAGALEDQGLCANEEDFYAVDLSVGDTLNVSVLYDAFRLDMDLDLFGPDNALLARSNAGGDVDAITFTAQGNGRHFLRVYPFGNDEVGASVTYDLVVEIEPEPEACIEDEGEPNEDPEDATRLPFTGGVAEFAGLALCLDDTDTYTFVLLEAADLDLRVTLPTTVPGSSVSLTTPDQETIVGSPVLGGRLVQIEQADPGVYTLEVTRGGAGTIQALYSIQIQTASEECLADIFEPNDNPNLPTRVSLGRLDGLRLCGDERDCYAVDASIGERIIAELLFDHEAGNLNLSLQNTALQRVGASNGIGHTERIDQQALETGEFVVCVEGQDSGLNQPYTLLLDKGAACNNDLFEPNDAFAQAHRFPVNTSVRASVCGDQDWFRVPTVAGQRLDILVDHEVEGVDLQVVLLDADQQVVGEAQGQGTERIFDLVLNEGGDLFVGILNPSEVSLSYNIRVQLEDPVGGCVEDGQEPDDTPEGATELSEGDVIGAALCDAVDHFVVDVDIHTELAVQVTGLSDLGRLAVDIFDETGTVLLGTGRAEHNVVTLTHSARSRGERIVRVTAAEGNYRGGYTIGLLATGADAACIQNYHEPDEDSPKALTRTRGQLSGAICDEALDVLTLPLEVGDKVELTLDFPEGAGNLDMSLVGPGESLVANAVASGPGRSKEIIGADITSAGIHEVRIVPSEPGQQAAYTLTHRIDAALVCEDDLQEPNDNVNEANEIAEGLHLGLSACSSDEDWYFVDLTGGDVLEVNLAYPPGTGDVEVEVLGVNQALLAGSYGVDGLERIVFNARLTQIHFVRVFIPGRGSAPYVMDLSINE